MPQYQGVWTLQQQMQALTSGQWVTDPNFKNTTLLLQADNAANSAQNNTFYDSSTNAFSITRNGNTTQGSFTPFSNQPGAWGNYFSSGNYISVASNAAFAYGTGAITVEFWHYSTTSPTSAVEVWVSNGGNTLNIQRSSGGFYNVYDGSDRVSTTPVVSNQWNHVAFVRQSGGQTNLYVNGTSVLSWTSSVNYGNDSFLVAGSGSFPFPGYISNLRVLKGTAQYTAAFFPPTSPLTAITNTSLLTCQSNRFVDNSASPLTISITGTPSVQPFSPFAPQYQWTSDVIGGSGYFDGTGDYLSSTQSAYAPSGDFTVEAWFYAAPDFSGYGGICTNAASAGGTGWRLVLSPTPDTIGAWFNGTSFTNVAYKPGQWYHVALVRSGTSSNNVSFYINGVRQQQITDTTAVTSQSLVVGRYHSDVDNYYLKGYISAVRVVVGTAVYSGASFTLPTAPLTAVTNTKLLLNFTNAGIYDGTMKNNLETVGNAQISTSVVKYGSGSMYFDGTGDTLQIAPSVNALPINGNNFTIEFWYRFAVVPGTQYFYTQRYDGNNYIFIYATSTGWVFDTFSNAVQGPKITSSTITPDATNWHHFALVYLNGTYTMYVDGVSVGSQANSSVLSTLNGYIPTIPVYIASRANIDSYVNGYIDDLRITKGIARYTQNFIPPSVALPRQ
jgi:hypothetical protein